MFEFLGKPERLQCRHALCVVHLHLPAGYRPLKWNDPKIAEAIEDFGFFGFIPGLTADVDSEQSDNHFIAEHFDADSSSSPNFQ